MRLMFAALAAVSLVACAPLQTVEELRANPYGTHSFTSEKSPREAAALVAAHMDKCLRGSTYSPTGMETSSSSLNQREDEDVIVLSSARRGMMGEQAWHSIEISPEGSAGSKVDVHYPARAYEAGAKRYERVINEGYEGC